MKSSKGLIFATQMKKVVLYARVSSREQEKEGFSIPAQLSLLREYAKKNNVQVVREFVEAETAKSSGRQKFGEMLDYLKSHSDVRDILVEKNDRLSRNFKDIVAVDPDSTGLIIHLVKDGVILSRDSGSTDKLMFSIQASLSKHYIDKLKEEVRKGMREKAEQGLWPSNAGYGYRNTKSGGDKRVIVPDPKTAPFVVRAFEMMATGQYSLQMIAQELYSLGARTNRGKVISKSHVEDILHREVYYGAFRWNGVLHEGKHEPLIAKSLFDRAQLAMGRRHRPKLLKLDSTYVGVLTCGHCGCAITPDRQPKKDGQGFYQYYRCSNGRRVCTCVKYIREELIDEAFTEALKAIQLSPEAVELTRKALMESVQGEKEFHNHAVMSINGQIATLQNRIDKSYDDYLDGRLPQDEWQPRNDQWRKEMADLRAKLQAHDRADFAYMREGVKLLELASQAPQLFLSAMTSAEKREIVSLVLSNPRVENGTIRYDYKKPFSLMLNSTKTEEWLGD